MTKLNDVSLVIADTVNIHRAINAINFCTRGIKFAEIILFTDTDISANGIRTVKIKPLKSIVDYSYFVFKEMANHIKTGHALIIQHDGLIINPDKWDNEFLKFDYIGAPWGHRSGLVGNGGFSLRSLRLMQELQRPYYDETHPEDDRICRLYGTELIEQGFKFAPRLLAERFSWEPNGYRPFETNPFGAHGVQLNLFEKLIYYR